MDLSEFVAAVRDPIPGPDPAGHDVRLDNTPNSIYARVRSLRAQAKATERQMRMGGTPETPWKEIWGPIRELVSDALLNETKDIELAVYLVEGLTREQSFEGLAAGLQVIRGLLEEFWETVYPRDDDGDFEYRLSFINALNGIETPGTLITIIQTRPLTKCQTTGVMFGLCHWTQCVTNTGPRDKSSTDTGKLQKRIYETAESTAPEFFEAQCRFVESALDELAAIAAIIDEHCGVHALHTSQMKSALEEYLAAAKILSKHRDQENAVNEPEDSDGVDVEPDQVSEQSPQPTSADDAPIQIASSGPVKSREDAFQKLTEVADFFRRTEPHSPMSYAIDNVVRWGNLPLPQLIDQLIPDESARRLFCMLTGINEAEPAPQELNAPMGQPGMMPEYPYDDSDY